MNAAQKLGYEAGAMGGKQAKRNGAEPVFLDEGECLRAYHYREEAVAALNMSGLSLSQGDQVGYIEAYQKAMHKALG